MIPANPDTSAKQMVFIEEIHRDHIRITNSSGSDISQGDLVVVENFCGVADEDIADGAEGTLHVEEGILLNANDLVSGEDTFATLGAPVYFKASTGEFSDTETATYYKIGYLARVKDSDGVIGIEKKRYADLISA